MRRMLTVLGLAAAMVAAAAPTAWACGFLVSPNGAVRLENTTTFVAWEDGVEHYITNFAFSGEVESFGSLIPLPAEPTEVRRAGDWTLQRLQREVSPVADEAAFGVLAASATTAAAEVILRTRIDSLDLVVLKGGAGAVLDWVNDNGFDLPPGPQTDHMLEFYASRSPYFVAARFDAEAAAVDGFTSGDGIPVQITIPTDRPWVPLHILHGASPDTEVIRADVFLLTPDRPDLLYGEGLEIGLSAPASDLLLDDLRSDENMEWVPTEGWLTHLELATEAENVVYDLSIGVDESGPSFVDAGFTRFEPTPEHLERMGLGPAEPWWRPWVPVTLLALLAGATGGGAVARRLRAR